MRRRGDRERGRWGDGRWGDGRWAMSDELENEKGATIRVMKAYAPD